ncbi:iron-containing alcohol dehydrogenase [Nitratireductor sp. GCM10026969]|uniref:iron-containing alcohol dehydrogenase n=1 Tax=Nitratireductor sp. GCM10026969 TaxID=3252645 RepID=UPI003611F992
MLELTHPVALQWPPLVHFGIGTLARLGEWVDRRGYARPVVIADPVNAGRVDHLGLGKVRCFGDVTSEPDTAMLDKALLVADGADLVIGFGGGSAMDLAKLVSIMAGQNVSFRDVSGLDRAPVRRIGLAQVPTTAGTGSEVGARALITDPETHSKIATESIHMLADIAVIDPVLTESVPPMVTAATGIDAMAHCIEAYTSKRAHPIIDTYALQGIRLAGRYLKRAVEDGADKQARAALALAALYGGVCLGPVNTTAGHAVSYPLGTRHGLAHGIANALMFPHVLAANAPAVPQKTNEICVALGFSADDQAEILSGAAAFCAALGLDMRLRAHGVPEDDLEVMAKDAHAIRRLLDWNPVDLSVRDILALYQNAW